jgi:hypothetical protein
MLQWWVGKIYIYKRETLIWYTANNKQTTKKKHTQNCMEKKALVFLKLLYVKIKYLIYLQIIFCTFLLTLHNFSLIAMKQSVFMRPYMKRDEHSVQV